MHTWADYEPRSAKDMLEKNIQICTESDTNELNGDSQENGNSEDDKKEERKKSTIITGGSSIMYVTMSSSVNATSTE